MVIGAQRPLRLVCGITEHGWQPVVLTMSEGCHFPVDLSSMKRIPDDVQVERVSCRSFWSHAQWWRRWTWQPARALAYAAHGLGHATKSLVPVDRFYPWSIVAARRGAELARRHKVDLIWATTPSLSSACLAWRIATKTGIPMVIDFRDVARGWADDRIDRQERSRVRWERRILSDAAGMTYVAPEQFDVLAKKHPFIASKPHKLVYNWFDARELNGCEPKQLDAGAIVHGGILYGGRRRLDGLFEALLHLRDSAACSRRIRLVHFGGAPRDRTYLASVGEDPRMRQVLEVRDAVPHGEFVANCLGADILLVAVGEDHEWRMHAGAIPGKLFTYLSAGRPILVVGPAGCEAGRIVEQVNRGIAVASDDVAGLTDAVSRLLGGRGRNGALDLSPQAVQTFEAQAVLGELAAFFDEVTG